MTVDTVQQILFRQNRGNQRDIDDIRTFLTKGVQRAVTGNQTAVRRLVQLGTIRPCLSSNSFTCSLISTSSSRFAERALYSAT